MPTVLVTGAGGACGIGTIQSLQSETTHQVVGVDMDPTAVGIQFADDGMEVPAATDASWPEAIAKIVDECDIDVVVPTVDEELAVLPSLSRELPDDIGIVAPDQEVIDLAMDKYQTMRRLSAAGHPVPETWLATEHATINPSAFPLIVKPRGGRGSRGVQQVDDPEALSAHLAATPYEPEELLCQSVSTGRSIRRALLELRTTNFLAWCQRKRSKRTDQPFSVRRVVHLMLSRPVRISSTCWSLLAHSISSRLSTTMGHHTLLKSIHAFHQPRV